MFATCLLKASNFKSIHTSYHHCIAAGSVRAKKKSRKMLPERQVAPQQRCLLLVVAVHRGTVDQVYRAQPCPLIYKVRNIPWKGTCVVSLVVQLLKINHNNENWRCPDLDVEPLVSCLDDSYYSRGNMRVFPVYFHSQSHWWPQNKVSKPF